MMKIHKEGRTSLIIATILVLAAVTVVQLITNGFHWSHIIFYAALFVTWSIILYFFRYPSRIINGNDEQILSPADGKIVVVKEVMLNEYFGEKRLQVSVFMSPLNVHINYFPFSGIVKYFKYYPGKYLFAWAPKSSDINERTSIVIEHSDGKNALVRQIAGALARRIVWYCEEGNDAKQGDQLGFIKFGSRVDLFLPLTTNVLVKEGDKVVGGQTVIGTWE